ncbi:uncharacterized protein LY79DRAFT_66058 [Colletotrichum navitas]|uniref:Uncharacterized protein n=1 Tax=Colletotrichum navitas TaxID=681940 RepID=A0AAD8UZK6_9PEZI|nr:uncharacterized protein LY79DRAFT_66058 [Colletotrichum navitas]KAK1569884.1 hypothetical protein LY79DRAFT_66058 [Colletotrichum navitas]
MVAPAVVVRWWWLPFAPCHLSHMESTHPRCLLHHLGRVPRARKVRTTGSRVYHGRGKQDARIAALFLCVPRRTDEWHVGRTGFCCKGWASVWWFFCSSTTNASRRKTAGLEAR